MSNLRDSLLHEKEQLAEKIAELSWLIDSENFATIDHEQKSLLVIQLGVMRTYLQILTERISLLEAHH